MCYRYSNNQEEREFRRRMRPTLGEMAEATKKEKFDFNHTNGFAHQALPVITQERPHEISYMHWGLVPFWVKGKPDMQIIWKRGSTLNARGKEMFTKNSFREPAKKHRCLIPATAFIEFRNYNGISYPYLVQVINPDFPDDVTPFCIAGIYDRWVDRSTGELLESFAMVTTEANELMKQVHVNPKREDLGGRMPVIVKPKDYGTWLNPSATFEELENIIAPVESEMLRAYTITREVAKPKFDFSNPAFMEYQVYAELPGNTFNVPDL